MFDNPELKKLRQEIDLLSGILENMAQTQEDRHAEIMEKLEVIEAQLQEEGESGAGQIDDIKSEIEEVKSVVESVEGSLEES